MMWSNTALINSLILYFVLYPRNIWSISVNIWSISVNIWSITLNKICNAKIKRHPFNLFISLRCFVKKNTSKIGLFVPQQIGQASNGPRPFHPSQGNEFLDSRLNDRGQPPPGRNTGKQCYKVILIIVIRRAYAHRCELY